MSSKNEVVGDVALELAPTCGVWQSA